MRRCCSLVLVGLVGLATSVQAAIIFQTNTTWQYFKGTGEASTPDNCAWREIGFDDSAWSTGQAAFYYDNSPGNLTEYFGNTKLTDMFGGYTCLFLRAAFVLTNVADVVSLDFGAVIDDGYIAWINGVEVERYNMPGGVVPYNGTASATLAEPPPFILNTITNARSFLVSGTNVVTVQAFNAS